MGLLQYSLLDIAELELLRHYSDSLTSLQDTYAVSTYNNKSFPTQSALSLCALEILA